MQHQRPFVFKKIIKLENIKYVFIMFYTNNQEAGKYLYKGTAHLNVCSTFSCKLKLYDWIVMKHINAGVNIKFLIKFEKRNKNIMVSKHAYCLKSP